MSHVTFSYITDIVVCLEINAHISKPHALYSQGLPIIANY